MSDIGKYQNYILEKLFQITYIVILGVG